jgi:hypothetical protein
MPTLSEEDRVKAIGILERVRGEIDAVAGEDGELRFQLRRYVVKRLEFDERGTPTQRRKLKDQKWKFQRGLCYECGDALPKQGAELHRLRAMDGYTAANTQLLCRACHRKAEIGVAGSDGEGEGRSKLQDV